MATTKKKRQPSKLRTSGFGQVVLESLRGWERGEPLTVRQVRVIPQPRARQARQVRQLRTETLGVSQAVFARLIGVSPKLVEAWESGRNTPAGPVCRLFELIEYQPRDFLRRYTKSAA
jgi:putative transcriptional regulator